MGGSPSTSSSKGRRKAQGIASAEGEDKCPRKFKALVSNPVPGILPGTWLEVKLDVKQAPPRVIFVDLGSGATVGSLTGTPGLNVLIDCLNDDVRYRAHVESVSRGRVDVTVVRH